MSEGADELKATLAEPAFAEMHPSDAGAHGLADGLGVRLRTAAGEADVPLRVTEHVAPGTVFVPFNQPGLAANTLLVGRVHDRGRRSSRSSGRDRGAGGGRGGRPVTWIDWGILLGKVVIVFAGLLVSVLLFIWMERKVIADLQTRLGTDARGPARCAALPRRRDQALLQGGDPADPVRPVGLPAGADVRGDPRVPRVRGRAVRPLGAHLRPDRRAAAGRPVHRACCGCSR